MTDDEKKHAELSELLGLLKTHRALIEARGPRVTAAVSLVLHSVEEERDKLAQGRSGALKHTTCSHCHGLGSVVRGH